MKTETKEKAIVSIFLILFMLVGLIVVLLINKYFIEQPTPLQQPVATCSMNPYIFETIESKIVRLATDSDVLPETALRIGRCESNLDPLAKNPNSSASGIYQFVSKTWDNYCDGDVYNPEDNIKCFLEIYPKHPEYWFCK